MMLLRYLLLFCLAAAATANINEKHFATSTRDMTLLLRAEDDLLDQLRQYVAKLYRKVDTIRLAVQEASLQQQRAASDPEAYVSNPLQSFPLMRRIYEDAPKWLEFAQLEAGLDQQQYIAEFNLSFITKNDLTEAATGLLRIQDSYDLDEQRMAQGWLRHKQYDARLSAMDCAELADHLYKNKKKELAVKWMEVALQQYDETPVYVYKTLKVFRADFWNLLGSMLSLMTKNQEAFNAYENAVKHTTDDSKNGNQFAWNLRQMKNLFIHLANCRGESELPNAANIRCRYNTDTSPFLSLAPLKLEQLSIDPYVVLYHDVIYSKEMQTFKELAQPHMTPALVGRRMQDKRRTAMSHGLSESSTPLETLQNRIEDMTGFDLNGSEALTIINYGIGGQYYCHNDCGRNEKEMPPDLYIHGNRVATVLFYISEASMGGITSFPELRLGIQPKLGSALVWHNLDHANLCDERLQHAACPVILGSRWVATQWINVPAQWRIKPSRGEPVSYLRPPSQ